MNEIKLIFSDIDNTLTSYGKGFTDILKSAIQKCHDNDIEFVLCSGRPTHNLINIAAELIDDGVYLKYVAGFNGCEIYDLVNKTYIHRELLVEPQFIVEQLNSIDVDHLMYYENTIYSSNLANEFSIREANSTKLNIEELTNIPRTPKVVALVHPDNMTEILAKTKQILKTYTVVDSAPFFIDITNKGSDKGAGLIKMAEILNISIDNVMCFGDAGNDLSMFKVCKNGIAVANATEEIKAHASLIIDSVMDDGVAKYILKYLGEK